MSVEPRQLLLLAIAIGVPVTAFFLNRARLVMAWVGFTLFVQIFDTTIVTNLPAGRLVGLLFLPAAVATFRHWSKLPPARAWILNFAYMILLGLLFGFLFPWPDVSGVRSFGVRAQGRTIIFLIRTLSDLSLTVYVMRQLAHPGAFDYMRKWMVRGAALSSAFAFVTLGTRIDFYSLITGLRAYGASDFRPRGLAFEARGLGLACAYGLILLLSKRSRSLGDWMALLVIAAGLAVSASSSALAAALTGLLVIALIGSMRVRLAMLITVTSVVMIFFLVATIAPAMLVNSRYAIESRLQGRGVVESNVPANAAEAVALHLDVFDASAALFLIRNPVYAITGTGPGLISLPASSHIPAGVYRIVFPVIDNPPSHGLLLELANTGILGVVLWTYQIAVVYLAGRRMRHMRRGLPFSPLVATTTFTGTAALYAVQVGPSPFAAVFLGIGWAISHAYAASTARALAHRRAALPAPSRPPGIAESPVYHS
jgi:hypothetical protein